jgi:riboflavin synthase
VFTGLIEQQGVVLRADASADGRRLVVSAGNWTHEPAIGASFAVNGCCLTVVEREGDALAFDVIPQTLAMTTLGDLKAASAVNLEAAATMQSRFDGHMVQGHVDGVGTIAACTDDADGRRLRVELDPSLAELCVAQGSIAIDGVSLTVSDLGDDWIEVALIPLTLRETTLGATCCGDRVNVETDMLARHVARLMERRLERLDTQQKRS